LGQVFQFFNVGGIIRESAKPLFHLREVSHGKRYMDPDNAISSCRLQERVQMGWLCLGRGVGVSMGCWCRGEG
jgi:hypothetical protein